MLVSSMGSTIGTPFCHSLNSNYQKQSSRKSCGPCKVCGDGSSGKHYGIMTCDGCNGFFKRSIRYNRQYRCNTDGSCQIDKKHRNECRACRLKKCFEVGMNSESVQPERGPRKATIQKAFQFEMSNTLMISHAVPNFIMTPPTSPQFSSFSSPQGSPCSPQPSIPMYSQYLRVSPEPNPAAADSVISAEQILGYPASVLVSNTKFIKELAPFKQLSIIDQDLLFDASWREFFVMRMAKELPNHFAHVTKAYEFHGMSATLLREIQAFQDIVNKFCDMGIDSYEFFCLQEIVLYKTDFGNDSNNLPKLLQEPSRVKALQITAKNALAEYESNRLGAFYGIDYQIRYKNLLALLPSLKLVSEFAIEGLFFRHLNAPLLHVLKQYVYRQ